MLTAEEINKIKVARVKCNNSLLFFTRYFFMKNHKRKFVVNKHHEIIIEALEKVVKGEIKRLIINIAPRYSKTELAVKNFIAWCLANNNSAKFIHLSYSDDLALDNSEEIKDLILSEDYQLLYPTVKLKKDSKSKKKWYTQNQGGVYATSASGQVTGFGAGKVDEEENEFLTDIENNKKFGGAIIIDDPIKPDDVETVVREKVNYKFDSTIRNRVNSRNTPIIIIMQRLHPNDLCGYLMEIEQNEWNVISLPVLDENNEPLWEFKHTKDELFKLRSINSVVFDTQYMQNPQPKEGVLIPKSAIKMQTLDLKPYEIDFSFAVTDPADKGGDKYSIPFIQVIQYNNDISFYVNDVIHNKDGTMVNCERVPLKVSENNTQQIWIESNGIGLASVLLLKKQLSSHTTLSAFPSTVNKEIRILSNYEFIIKYFIFNETKYNENKEYKDFINDLTSYSKEGDNTHKKDAIDVLSTAAQILKIKYKSILFC